MNTHTTIEMIAPTIEEAVEKGLADLGLTAEEVEVEVLDSGARGLFGLGTRQARVRLIVKGAHQTGSPVSKTASTAESSSTSLADDAGQEAEIAFAEDVSYDDDEIAAGEAAPQTDDQVLNVARATVAELLDKMGVRAAVTARYGEGDDNRDRVPVQVDIRGDDLSILIGKRAETLNALQYIAGLIVGKELGHSISLIVDVEGYRQRRTNQLRQLARRMADQVAKTGRRLALEPMPANERRIIHIELRNHSYVTTESVGEEPHRKVTIVPKE